MLSNMFAHSKHGTQLLLWYVLFEEFYSVLSRTRAESVAIHMHVPDTGRHTASDAVVCALRSDQQ